MTYNLYSYPKLSNTDLFFFRVGGPGLGNLLFPWARSLVSTLGNKNITPVWPTWAQCKVGPLIRRENDARLYAGLFSPTEKYIYGFNKFNLLNLRKTQKISEVFLHDIDFNSLNDRDVIVEYSGLGDMFESISDHHGYIKNQLLKITMDTHKNCIPPEISNYIAVHIRKGDFAKFSHQKSGIYPRNMQLPSEWYINLINQINFKTNSSIPIAVFSDAADFEISDVLGINNVERMSFGSPLSDLLAISNAKAIIMSNSTFSQWAAYLGRKPAISFKGVEAGCYFYNKHECEFNVGLKENIPERYFNYIFES